MSAEETYTPKQLARALQVSESSVKRWCDRGDIRTDKTVGGHRRIPKRSFLEFLRETNRRLVRPDELFAGEYTPIGDERKTAGDPMQDLQEDQQIRDHLARSLVSGNEPECRRAISAWCAQHSSIASLGDELLCPVLREIGEGWRCGEVDVFQERLGCDICARLIHDLRRSFGEPNASAPLAMGGTPSGDHYQLSNQMVELVFRESGWRTIAVGTNLPFESLLAAAHAHQPRVFWLSVSYIECERTFLETFRAFSSGLPTSTLLVVGGRALHEEIRPSMTFSAHCDSLKQLAMLSKTMLSARL